MKRARLNVVGNEQVGAYFLVRVARGVLDAGVPGQFFMLEAPGRVLPRPMSVCLAPPGELAFLIDPIGPGTRALCALEPGEAIHVLGPLGNKFGLPKNDQEAILVLEAADVPRTDGEIRKKTQVAVAQHERLSEDAPLRVLAIERSSDRDASAPMRIECEIGVEPSRETALTAVAGRGQVLRGKREPRIRGPSRDPRGRRVDVAGTELQRLAIRLHLLRTGYGRHGDSRARDQRPRYAPRRFAHEPSRASEANRHSSRSARQHEPRATTHHDSTDTIECFVVFHLESPASRSLVPASRGARGMPCTDR